MRLPRKLPARRLRPADLPASCGAASLLAQQYLRPISQGVKILSAPPADPPSFSRCPSATQIRPLRGSRRTAVLDPRPPLSRPRLTPPRPHPPFTAPQRQSLPHS